MANSFDQDPRGTADRKLGVIGLCFAVVASIVAVLMVIKSQGKLDDFVRVDLKLVNIGDGLPERSDVKFRGVIVGMVSGVSPSQHGSPNVVHVDIQPQFSSQIPDNVTARVVPANLFAVSAVQLVQNGRGARPIRSGDVIQEDQTLPTVLFQNVLAKLRQLLKAVGQGPDSQTVGVFAALSEATHGRGQKLTDAGHNLSEVMRQLNSVAASDDSGPTTLSALKSAADSLRTVSPDLFAALDSSVKPMKTIAEKRSQLTSFLGAGLNTTATLGDLGSLLKLAGANVDVPAGTSLAISVAARGPLVMIGGGETFARHILEADDRLADQAGYKKAIARAADKNLGQVYVAAAALLPLAESSLPAAEKATFDTDVKPYLEPFDALVMTTTTDGTLSRARVVATVK